MTTLKVTNSDIVNGEISINIPEEITSLDFSWCTNLTAVPDNLPAGLTSLYLDHCTNLTAVPDNLPAGLTSLSFRRCTRLTAVPDNWPADLTSLSFSGCRNLTAVPDNWPAGLTSLYLYNCRKLTAVPDNWPADLTSLSFSGCRNLTAVPDNWPAGLTSLYLYNCRKLTAVPDNWPAGLTSLSLYNCRNLTAVPDNWPAGLTSLDFSWCRNLTAVPDNLPAGLTSLSFRGCAGLTALPEDLKNLTYLDLSGCTSLGVGGQQSLSDIRAILEDATHGHINITWPEHIPAAHDLQETVEMISNCDIFHENKYSQLKTLLERFCTESTKERTLSKINEQVGIVLNFITNSDNTSHIQKLNEIASVYNGGCVNQPVAGFLEIASIIKIMQAESLWDKIKSAEQLLIFEEVRNYVATDKKGPGREVEVEAGNVLFNNIYKELKQRNVVDEGLGIQDKIVYAPLVNSYVNDNIQSVRKCINKKLPFLNNEPNEVRFNSLKEFLTDGIHVGMWRDIAFPELKASSKIALEKKTMMLLGAYLPEPENIKEPWKGLGLWIKDSKNIPTKCQACAKEIVKTLDRTTDPLTALGNYNTILEVNYEPELNKKAIGLTSEVPFVPQKLNNVKVEPAIEQTKELI